MSEDGSAYIYLVSEDGNGEIYRFVGRARHGAVWRGAARRGVAAQWAEEREVAFP